MVIQAKEGYVIAEIEKSLNPLLLLNIEAIDTEPKQGKSGC
jgi:hypothetical protein